MASWISDLDCGSHPVVGRCYSGYTVAARVGIGLRLSPCLLPRKLHSGNDIDILQDSVMINAKFIDNFFSVVACQAKINVKVSSNLGLAAGYSKYRAREYYTVCGANSPGRAIEHSVFLCS